MTRTFVLIPSSERRFASLFLSLLVCSIFAALCRAQNGTTFMKLENQQLVGTKAMELTVRTRNHCAAIAKIKNYDGFFLTTGNELKCSGYSSVTTISSATGTNSYIIEKEYDKYRTHFNHNGKVLMPFPIHASGLTYASAKSWCTSRGGTMFIPKNSDDWDFILRMAIDRSYSHTWFPMTDLKTEGTYLWEDGTSVANSYPVPGGIYSNSDSEDCVSAHLNGQAFYVHGWNCDSLVDGFVCEQ